jgi:hypothetical protein
MSEIADILDKAADLIEPEGAWCQRDYARNADGLVTGLSEFRGPATCWCIAGATAKVDPQARGASADGFLQEFLGVHPSVWNDAPGRTQAEVVAKLREAAAKARGQS